MVICPEKEEFHPCHCLELLAQENNKTDLLLVGYNKCTTLVPGVDLKEAGIVDIWELYYLYNFSINLNLI